MFKPLDQYYFYIMSLPLGGFTPLFNGAHEYGDINSVTLHRKDYFQTELFILRKGVQLIEYHYHPDVETYVVPVSGDFMFESDGVEYRTTPDIPELGKKKPVHTPEGVIHGGVFDTQGSFLTIEYWKNGKLPDSVGDNFVIVDHPNHKLGLRAVNRKDHLKK
jgi:hypothetical protein